jgi:uncharacterized protein
MSDRDGYRPGEFCWVDLATTDYGAAKTFYSDLLGDEFEDAPGSDPESGFDYGFLMRDGKLIGGIGSTMSPDQPPAWSSYVWVESADQSVEKVKAAGGTTALEPMDLPNNAGRMAMCQDPEGAFFGIYEARDNRGAELVNELGCWTWSNRLTRDLEGMKRFYGEVFGWSATSNPEAPEGILNWQVEDQRWPEGLGGLMAMPDDIPPEIPPYWEVYFIVEELDGAIEKTRDAGGQLMAGPLDLPIARIATVTDPQGAAVSLMEADYPDPR